MSELVFEGAGWEKAGASSDIGNCRIRTRVRNNAGLLIYLECNGFESTKYMPRKYPLTGHVMHCFEEGCNEASDWRRLEREVFQWTAAGLLAFVNERLACSFDSLRVVNDGLHVHGTAEPLCESNKHGVGA